MPVPARFRSPHSYRNYLLRMLWQCVWTCVFRLIPAPFHGVRRAILRAFGARLGVGSRVYPSAKVWAPWLLEMGDYACLGPGSDCYNVGGVKIGRYAVVSQYSHLCGATHDHTDPAFPLISKVIRIEEEAWIGAGAFVGPGVTIGPNAVVGARAVVVKDVPPSNIVAGNPARFVRYRVMKHIANGSSTV